MAERSVFHVRQVGDYWAVRREDTAVDEVVTEHFPHCRVETPRRGIADVDLASRDAAPLIDACDPIRGIPLGTHGCPHQGMTPSQLRTATIAEMTAATTPMIFHGLLFWDSGTPEPSEPMFT